MMEQVPVVMQMIISDLPGNWLCSVKQRATPNQANEEAVMQVVGKEIVPRPIMNVALTYDHRLIDGREAVTFLKRVKDIIEDPRRLMLDI